MPGEETSSGAGVMIFMIIYGVVILAIVGALVAGLWKVFEKAGKPGWASIVPIYSVLVLLEIVGKPAWWILLLLCTGPIGGILIGMALPERFGKTSTFGIVALGLFPMVGFPMIGFGDAKYTAPPAA